MHAVQYLLDHEELEGAVGQRQQELGVRAAHQPAERNLLEAKVLQPLAAAVPQLQQSLVGVRGVHNGLRYASGDGSCGHGLQVSELLVRGGKAGCPGRC